jgi:hypothetical protein
MGVRDDGACKDGINGASDVGGGRLDSTRRNRIGRCYQMVFSNLHIHQLYLFISVSLYGHRSFR